jgi:CRISPR-associated endonuclease Csn1
VEKGTKDLHKKPNNMAKILGLDLGTNSIGWAVINAKMANGKVEEYLSIDDSGVRIFPEGVEPTTIGQGDKEQSKNANRREHRQMRRQFYRKKLRKVKLLETLIDLKMCPLSEEGLNQWSKWYKDKKTEGKQFPTEDAFVDWLKLNPYELRAKALTEMLSLMEFGRILYHFIQRRGFLSSRKGTEDGAIFKGKDNMSGIDATRGLMNGQTLGKSLFDISYKEGEKYNRKKDFEGNELRVRARYTQRNMYISEFQQIWEKQAEALGLNTKEIKIKKVRFLNGNAANNRNRKKISGYFNAYGKENVLIEGKRITTFKYIPLKTFLAGEIKVENEQLKFKSNESLLFWQRPLRSQKGLLDNCRLENNLPVIMGNGAFRMKNGKVLKRSKKPCPLSHPEFELFRAYQLINNIKYGKGRLLTKEQRELVLDLINSKDSNFNFDLIPKALNLTYEKFNYEDDQKIAGNTTIKKLKPLFAEEVWNADYEKIWHCFFFFEDNDKLFAKLRKDFSLKANDSDKIAKIRLKEGYANVSLKAIRNINPFLEKGYSYSDAVILGGIKNAFGKRWDYFDVDDTIDRLEKDVIGILHENNKEGEAIEKVKDYLADPFNSYGFTKDDPYFTQLYHHSQEISVKELQEFVPEVENLRNPIVQQGLQEMRRLVNSLLNKYRVNNPDFKFDRIHIEMGRDLKNNKTKRRELTLKIRDNEQKNDEARKRLAEFGIRPTRDNLLRYLLFDEIQKHISGPVLCPYTGKVIGISDLLGGGNTVQIEHIIPYSVSLNDSFANKTLCEAKFNSLKAEKTPYEFYSQNPDPKLWGIKKHEKSEDGWSEIAERAFKLLPYPKARRFTSKKKFEKATFIERQLNDTRYISRKAVELLSAVCEDVRMLPGQVTAELRHLWGINNILNPVNGFEKFEAEVRGEERLSYYVVADENNRVVDMVRKTNDRPNGANNQLVISGSIDKGRFSSKYLSLKIDVPELSNGNYWALLNVSEPHSFQPVFADKPESNEEQIVLKGRVEKETFINDSVTRRIKTPGYANGSYWARFSIVNKEFKFAEGRGKIKATGNKIALFGEVKEGLFTCHIYHCDTNLVDGKYWVLLELDFENAEFTRTVNPKPDVDERQLLSYATVDETGAMAADPDPGYQVKTNQPTGRYYCTFDIQSVDRTFFPMENEAPKFQKDQRLTEAVVWVDEATGEIKYDPKKNRDDHRHHAIDAITVALTEQGYLQRLSTYHAKNENAKRGIDSTENFPEPWKGFARDVKKATEAMLISHKQNNKVLTKISKTVTKNGEKHRSVGFAARGQLHKETVFGKRQPPNHNEAYHIRKPITGLKDKKQIDKVVDDKIRQLILEHLRDNCGVDISNDKFSVPKDAFFKDGQPRLFLPNRKGGEPVPVKKVRMREVVSNAEQLKIGINQFVNPRNNHHIVVFERNDKMLDKDVVSFLRVVERKLNNEPVVQLPSDGKKLLCTFEANDMFLLGLTDDEFYDYKHDMVELSKHLYRVQKIAGGSYFFEICFRHHTDSRKDQDAKQDYKYIKGFGTGTTGWYTYNPIKAKIDPLGNIEKI